MGKNNITNEIYIIRKYKSGEDILNMNKLLSKISDKDRKNLNIDFKKSISDIIKYEILDNYIILDKNNNLFGFILINNIDNVLYIKDIYIATSHRRKGYCNKLIQYVINSNDNNIKALIKNNKIMNKIFTKLNFKVISDNGNSKLFLYNK